MRDEAESEGKKSVRQIGKLTNYEAESPAARTARKWDEREGEIIVQNYNLRRLMVGMLAVVMFMTVGPVYKSLSSNVMLYIVEVDTTTGAVRNVGTVEASTIKRANQSTNIFSHVF